MATFVHIAPEAVAASIRRSGLAGTRLNPHRTTMRDADRAVWAFPVLPSHTLTYSWSRELKRTGVNTICAVVFRIADVELVFARHFNGDPAPMTAAEAVALIRALPDPRGYEVMVPRRVRASEILRIESMRRPVGWRVFPQAKDTPPPLCDCPVCAPPNFVRAAKYRASMIERMKRAGLEPMPTRREQRALRKREAAMEAAAQTNGAAATQ